jgi:hypothetical protein
MNALIQQRKGRTILVDCQAAAMSGINSDKSGVGSHLQV